MPTAYTDSFQTPRPVPVAPGPRETSAPLHFYRKRTYCRSCRSRRGRVPLHSFDRGNVSSIDLPQGTLDLLILKALSLQPMHGWAISERLHHVSRATLQIPQVSLYPALHRLERRGLIQAEWGASDNNRKAKYYDLTRAGRKQLAAETDDWARLTTAVALVL